MTVWIRTFPCACCGGTILYDDKLWTITCHGSKRHPCLPIELKTPMPDGVIQRYYINIKSLPNCVDAGCPMADPETGACQYECCIAHPTNFFEGAS